MLGAMLFATVATFLVSRAVGRFESPVVLITVRLLIAAGIGVPVALLLTVGTRVRRSRMGDVIHRSWAMVPWH